jgi:hypothetical protein
MTELHDAPARGGDTGPTMDATATASGTRWEARPLAPRAPGGRWGVAYLPTGRWVAFGGEARCRALVAHLTEVDAILARNAPPASS